MHRTHEKGRVALLGSEHTPVCAGCLQAVLCFGQVGTKKDVESGT